MTFKELGLDDRILEAISYMGYDQATPIQEKTIPEIIKGRDLIACAQTGTGKTAAFMLPLLHKLTQQPHKGTSTLVIVPTRELALQIDQQIQGFAYFVQVSAIAVYGGGSGSEWEQQKKALSNTDIIVATPGKLISHINMGHVRFQDVKYLILDEADRMLDMGFYDDIKKIIDSLPKNRQTLMFSATMPPKMRKLAKQYLTNPYEVSIAISKPSERVLQVAYLVNDGHKAALIRNLIKNKPSVESIIIFSSTKKSVNSIIRSISGQGYQVEGISSDLDQQQREEVLNRFRAKQTRVLVATDVLSRGIDIKDIHLVINYNVPGDAEDYVHRIGRTARADASGVAITLINEEEMRKFAAIEHLIEAEITKLPISAEIGESPEWNPVKRKSRHTHGHLKTSKKHNNNRHQRKKHTSKSNKSYPKTDGKSDKNTKA
ncbi:MAG: DEAD/DEAH box helicase [Saprospiraceae bacterium]|nr:MAG: DEAD/DEAH box helicase [Bacteroidetes bacterium OLB9]MCO6463262.1 DEAD/DEAH box helicase [Saprospiraceae bacterium]MCZ2337292.1 DEAD/DEAH box helicase [Chitinophagales bacterium]